MGNKHKQRKELKRKDLPQEDLITREACLSFELERATFMMEPYHELDPDGDILLILNPCSLGYKNVVPNSQSEGVVIPNQLEISYHFN